MLFGSLRPPEIKTQMIHVDLVNNAAGFGSFDFVVLSIFTDRSSLHSPTLSDVLLSLIGVGDAGTSSAFGFNWFVLCS